MAKACSKTAGAAHIPTKSPVFIAEFVSSAVMATTSQANISAIAVLFDDATQQHLPEEFGKVVAEQRVRFYITDRMAPEKAPSPINLAADSSRTPMVNATSGASAELAARLDRIRGKSLAAISEDRGVPAAMNLSLESINLDDSA